MYLNLSIKIKVENLPQNKQIGRIVIILFSILKRHAIWIKVIKIKDWTPKEPTLLSFIALNSFFLPANIPSKVSINPSIWRPPVIKYPETKQIGTEA